MDNFIATVMVYIAMTASPYMDLIEKNGANNVPVVINGKTVDAGLRDVIAPPLSHDRHLCYEGHDVPLCRDIDEYAALVNGFWNRQAEDIWRFPNQIRLPRPHQQMAISHLMNGGAVRVGDKQVVYGSLLSARRPDTYLLAKQLESDMDHYKKCLFEKDPSCVGY